MRERESVTNSSGPDLRMRRRVSWPPSPKGMGVNSNVNPLFPASAGVDRGGAG